VENRQLAWPIRVSQAVRKQAIRRYERWRQTLDDLAKSFERRIVLALQRTLRCRCPFPEQLFYKISA
jgi:hypothetical protein